MKITAFSDGVRLNSSLGVTVWGNYIRKNGYGVNIDFSSNSSILGNYITDNDFDGVDLDYSSWVIVSGNSITYNDYDGLDPDFSSNCTISGNTIANNNCGVTLEFSLDNSFSGNNITNNNYGVYLSASPDNAFLGNSLADNNHGIYLDSSSNSTVSGNTFTNDGFEVWDSHVNSVGGNFVNGKPLVYLENASGAVITDAGEVVLIDSDSIVIDGLNLSNASVGVLLWHTNNTRITNNNISNNTSVGVDLVYSFNNTILTNNIRNNGEGVYLDHSSSNVFFHNNFVDNLVQANIVNSSNMWDGGYLPGGNYWSDYAGTDYYHGPLQDLLNGEGIGDTAYVMDVNNTDRYPLMGLFRTFDAGVWNGTRYYVDIVSLSDISNFNFNPFASPNPTLSFDVSGEEGTLGFSRVVISKGMMWVDTPSEWTITVGGKLTAAETILEFINDTYIYFPYTHSIKTVQIQSSHAVPEFQPTMLIAMLLVLSLVGAMIFKKKRSALLRV